MKNKLQPLLILIALVMLSSGISAQSTTVYLVRHAEKDTSNPGNSNPELNEEGMQRAKDLQLLLADEKIDAIFSTNYIRTKNTVQPISEATGLAINIYDPRDLDQFAESLKSECKGRNVLVVGHSNTVLETIQALGGKRPLPTLTEEDYGTLFKVKIGEDGEVETSYSDFGRK